MLALPAPQLTARLGFRSSRLDSVSASARLGSAARHSSPTTAATALPAASGQPLAPLPPHRQPNETGRAPSEDSFSLTPHTYPWCTVSLKSCDPKTPCAQVVSIRTPLKDSWAWSIFASKLFRLTVHSRVLQRRPQRKCEEQSDTARGKAGCFRPLHLPASSGSPNIDRCG